MELIETYIPYGSTTPKTLAVNHDPVDGVATISIFHEEVDLAASFNLTRDQARQVIAELQKLAYVDFKIGDTVYWRDPEPSIDSSGEYTITDITGTLDDLTIWLDDNSLPVSTHEITLIKSS